MSVRCLPARRAGIRTAGMLMLAFSLAACSDRAAEAPAPTPAPQEATTTAVVADPTGGSCLTAALGVCQDFTGSGHAPAIVRGTCEDQQLAYSTTACADDDSRLGTCLLFAGEPVESRLHYASSFPPGPHGAKSQCVDKLKGQWNP